MKFISFLLENIYWVIVVGGVLFSMFGRSGAKRRTNRMPSFGGGNESERPIPQHQRGWEEDEEETSYPPQKPAMAGSSVQGEGVGSGEGFRSSTLDRAVQAAPGRPSEPPRARLSANKPQAQAAASAAAELRTGVSAPTADEMRQAVVWAEILGPPRSKRPFGK